ncbi:DUF6338 family protein [Phenylobacterium sp.]|jgi:hypothetical protein|uniref:DUF6338 family protein n=1 Tax=Phenylobacterium sp. TaxID=1871053 RepID=UPI0037C58625
MGDLSKIATLTPVQFWALIVLFLPGFLSLKLHRFLDRRATTATEALIDVVGFSLLNAFVFAWPIYLNSQYLIERSPYWPAIIGNGLLACIAGPLIWPLAFRLLQRYGLRGGWLLGEQKTAFDAYFSTNEPCWVIVHLADGGRIGGYFGGESFASAHPHSGDFYLEELWEIDPEGHFAQPIANSKGAIFHRNDYIWLEFFWDDPVKQD